MLKPTGAAISVVCPSCSTQYLLPREKSPTSAFEIRCKRCSGMVPVDPTLVRAEKHVEAEGVRFELEGQPGKNSWRVLINGKPVAMTFTETETTVTNAASYDKTLRPTEAAEWLPLESALVSDSPFELTKSERGIYIQCDITGSKVTMYNTVIYDSDRLVVEVAPDLSSAALRLLHYTDSSS